jgi:ABC-2 type transport system permease protein
MKKLRWKWMLEWRMAATRNGMKDALAYRWDFLIDFFTQAFVPVGIQLILWNAIFHQQGKTEFAGMQYSELLAYTWTSVLFTQVRGGNYDFALIEMIRTGSLSQSLLRPVGPVEFVFWRGFGEKIFTAAFCLFLGLVATYFADRSLVNLILAMMLAVLGNVIHYLFGAILAAVGFYWENAFAILLVKNMVVSLLSGELLPLSLFPEKYTWIWKSTPFYLYVFGPTQIAMGKWSVSEWAHHMTIGFAWCLAFAIILKMTWKHAIRQYQGIGG